ncbi:MAG TPA: hypothetical protein DCR14_01335, partial [Acidimicrobiaceae bacterium]|nr:hypothetical protein [Acidimicrobiaceae bacterium]
MHPAAGHVADDVLALAAAVESASEHPIAKAVVRAATDRCLEVGAVDGFAAEAGVGASGRVRGQL